MFILGLILGILLGAIGIVALMWWASEEDEQALKEPIPNFHDFD